MYKSQDEIHILKNKLNSCGMPKHTLQKSLDELNKLKYLTPMSIEASIIRTYLEWLIKLPWNNLWHNNINLMFARYMLNKHHYGLMEINEIILEILAEIIINPRGHIICLVGPPGVGKTSLSKSITQALGRPYVRMSLGGINDVADIKGHRRTYIGAQPGRIIQILSQLKIKNPVILLEGLDKITSENVSVDLENSLLEVLDPEINNNYHDNYLEVGFDFSKIMFIATANNLNNISPHLIDRLEIINMNGYTEKEKIFIAKKYFIPQFIKNHKLSKKDIVFTTYAIFKIIRFYTMEFGLIELKRNINKIFRIFLKERLINKTKKKLIINKKNVKIFLGMEKYNFNIKNIEYQSIGQVNGLAWTEDGGDTMNIEVVSIPGRGEFIYTGSLGNVMQESIRICLTYIRFNMNKLHIYYSFFDVNDIHIHISEAAIHKDGPSAGIAIFTALVSCLTNNPVKHNIAMTGEINLFGKILPVGGLREKLLAVTKNTNIDTVLIPKDNVKDLKNITRDITSQLNIKLISNVEDALDISLYYK